MKLSGMTNDMGKIKELTLAIYKHLEIDNPDHDSIHADARYSTGDNERLDEIEDKVDALSNKLDRVYDKLDHIAKNQSKPKPKRQTKANATDNS